MVSARDVPKQSALLLGEHSCTLAQPSTDYPAADACAAGRELTDDREELVRLVERVMHLPAGSTRRRATGSRSCNVESYDPP